jgi:hypothetical protein
MAIRLENSYVIQDDVIIPTKKGKPCPCPYATRVLVPVPRQVMSAPGTMDMTLNVGYCNSQCPLFSIDQYMDGKPLCFNLCHSTFQIDKNPELIK